MSDAAVSHLRVVRDVVPDSPTRPPPSPTLAVTSASNDPQPPDGVVAHYASMNQMLEDRVGALTRNNHDLREEIEDLRARLEMAAATCTPPPRRASGEEFDMPSSGN